MNKVALVTGCSADGLGPHIVAHLHHKGYHVYATARTPSKIPQFITQLPRVTTFPLDVTSSSQIQAAVEHVKTKSGGDLHVLVNNGGVGFTRPVLDTSAEDLRRIYEVNVVGVLEVTKAFAPLMAGRRDAAIVNVSSIVALTNMPYQSAYAASKAALTSLSEILRLEFESLGIRSITLMLGLVESNLHPSQPFEPLPVTSYWAPLSGFLRDRAQGVPSKPVPSKPDDIAKSLISKLEKGHNGKIYLGTLAWPVFKYVQWWLPTSIWDRVMKGLLGDEKLVAKEVENRHGIRVQKKQG